MYLVDVVFEEKIKFSELRRHFMIPDMPTCVPSSTFSQQELAVMNDRQRPFQRRLEIFEDGHDPIFLQGSRHARYSGHPERSMKTGIFLTDLFARYVRKDKKTIFFRKDWLQYQRQIVEKLRHHVDKHNLYVHSHTWNSLEFKPFEKDEDYGSLSIIGVDQSIGYCPSILWKGVVIRVNIDEDESVIDYDKRIEAIEKLFAINEKMSTLAI